MMNIVHIFIIDEVCETNGIVLLSDDVLYFSCLVLFTCR